MIRQPLRQPLAQQPAQLADRRIRHDGSHRPLRAGELDPAPHQLALFLLTHQAQLREVRLGLRRSTGEQIGQMAEQPLDGGEIEQVGRVLHAAGEAVGCRAEGEREIELRQGPDTPDTGAGAGHRPEAQTRDLQALDGSVLHHQHHLEQGGEGEAPLRSQLLDEPFERQILVRMGGQRGLPGAAEESPEGRIGGQVAAQHQGVDEKPDQLLGLHPVAPGDRRAHREVVLAAVTGQQRLEGGEEHHEERRSFAPGEGLDLAGESGGQAQGDRGAAVGLHRGPRPVGGQREEGRQARELPAPVGDLALQDLAAQPGGLPDGKIRVLHGQLRQGGRPAFGERGVERHDLVNQDAHRPAVARDVMHGQHGDMVMLSQP